MSERFTKKWESKRDDNSFLDTLRGTVKQQPPLKPRLDQAVKRLDMQINRLDQANEKFAQKDKALFTKLVDAYTKHDTAHANIYANELAEVRKMSRLTMNARLALDQVSLRIKTVTEFGDIVTTLGPAIGVLRSVNVGMCGVLPEAENELGSIGDMLSGLMLEAGSGSGMTLNFGNVNEDASKILAEAATVAEQRVNANFPDLPPGLTAGSANSKSQT
ncbi:MAG: Snf7 family protein [Candidatus Bathyarchaeota archaeon]|nr:Snf7 family protein [Candidatus Bathyarchaeota archaeon]